MIKKIYITLISILFFISCTKLTIYSAYSSAKNNNYVYAIETIENSLRKENQNLKLLEAYRDLYQRGILYYKTQSNDENIFLLENSFLSLENNIKNYLKDIKVDEDEHQKRGVKVAKKLLKQAETIKEDKYRDKLKKYSFYKYILNFDLSLQEKINKKLRLLDKKIEKTYDIRVGGDRYFSNYTRNYLYNNLYTNYFRQTKIDSDMTLYVDIENLYYLKPNITVKTFPKNYRKKTIVANKEIIENITYFENNYSKETELNFSITYKLVSNISGEILFKNTKHINKHYDKKWKTYNFPPFSIIRDVNLPKDEKEKNVPTKNEIFETTLKKIEEEIVEKFKKLRN